MSLVRRVYVRKKHFDARARELLEEINGFLKIPSVHSADIFIRYDVEHLPEDVWEEALKGIFAEPPLDVFFTEPFDHAAFEADRPDLHYVSFSVEPLPGQYDQRADSCEQALRLLSDRAKPMVRTATTYLIGFDKADAQAEAESDRIRGFLVNPVDSRIAAEEIPDTLAMPFEEPPDVARLTGFADMSEEELRALYTSLSLAMSFPDFCWIQQYFRDTEHRDPTMTEVRVLDTYWSDHCRHTTFATRLDEIVIEDGPYAEPVRAAYEEYRKARDVLYADPLTQEKKPVCLMDLATAGMKLLRQRGLLTDMEESEENNACTVIVPVEIQTESGKRTEEWLVFFKNETHNHPTEIEPFGGAATCLGGAIRDPLSGRGYVYQAMRVTGASDPTAPDEQTLPGKLPQKKIVRDAARGYSSYGNQIGLCTGLVDEIYHPGYVAKRMEIGAVLGAAPRSNVKRLSPSPDDVVILVGGRTGRDGIGGATGSSKAHNQDSLSNCGAEVQKGNALTERKIQRLFRRREVSSLIKKCNDFGAGGVSVAIGELADGLEIYLDAVPKKYEGLDGTELAISESQERMAVVVSPADEARFIAYAGEENLEAVRVARVTDSKRLVMHWRGKKIVDIARAFLDTNGVISHANVRVPSPDPEASVFKMPASGAVRKALSENDYRQAWMRNLMELNVCSKRGLVEMFDASIGSASVVMPFGGITQMTPVQTMIAKLPVADGETDDATFMSYGFDPALSSWSPFHGAFYAVVHAVAKLAAAGLNVRKLHLTLQEYFGRMTTDPVRWGQPFAALLGAFSAQLSFGCAAIGGKDSMSGSFQELDVPPTLVCFAVGTGKASEAVTPELKEAGNYLVLFSLERDACELPDVNALLTMYDRVRDLMREGKICACYAADAFGISAALSKMAFGNELGISVDESVSADALFENGTGYLVAEVRQDALVEALRVHGAQKIGVVTAEKQIVFKETQVLLPEALQCWTSPLERVFPTSAQLGTEKKKAKLPVPMTKAPYICKHKTAVPRVFIPVMPGTNCEYDLTRAFEKAGAKVSAVVFQNGDVSAIRESVERFVAEIDQAQIIMFPGGFSAGDEPDGSAKYFATAFRNEKIREAAMRMLQQRDGLALGICNGFQAMIKLGLLPDGVISGQEETSPTLTYNTIGRHISRMAYLKVLPNASPWLAYADTETPYASPVSHGEGRFVAGDDVIRSLYANAQIATVYCDTDGVWHPETDAPSNLNGSDYAVEGILSPDGRCYGKMAHAERRGTDIARNITGEQDMRIFEAGVAYFRE